MWRNAESNDKPAEYEKLPDGRVIVRKNIASYTTDEGNTHYRYQERIMSGVEATAREAIAEQQVKREAEIIDDYTMALIEEGVI